MNFTPNSRIVAGIAVLDRYFHSQVKKFKVIDEDLHRNKDHVFL